MAEEITLDTADAAVRSQLARAERFLDEKAWEEAIQTLREVQQQGPDKLLPLTEERFVRVADHVNRQLAAFPPEPLAVYRNRIDPLARQWFEAGLAERDSALLGRVVGEAFSSRWTDRALWTLGEMALESGDWSAARLHWERLLPQPPKEERARIWLSVAETDIDPADVRARLVLVSILEGDASRARDELDHFTRLHPEAEGRLGGRPGLFVAALEELLVQSRSWPSASEVAASSWPTFAGTRQRNGSAARGVDPAGALWRLKLRETIPAHESIWGREGPTPRVAEDPTAPLSYHPVVVDGLVLVNNMVEIHAVELATGKPPWGLKDSVIHRDANSEDYQARYLPPNNLGVGRFTLSANGGRLYARMGSPVTGQPRRGQTPPGYLVCRDLRSQAKLVWKVMPEDATWSFDGTPLVDGPHVYVAMRHADIHAQAHVACLEAATGRIVWRRFICGADTPARAMLAETTHNLLSLDAGTLYVNTNLGAIAALRAVDGRVRWLTLHQRERRGDLLDPPDYRARDLNPCLIDRGRLLVAPVDSPRILCLDAATGEILWRTGPEVGDVQHLLGVTDDAVIVSGRRLYWIGLSGEQAGRIVHRWPDGPDGPGWGRGVLAGGEVYWPTRDAIRVFDQKTGRPTRAIDLTARGVAGGNLVIVGDKMLVVSHDELIALGETSHGEPGPRVAHSAASCRSFTGQWLVGSGQWAVGSRQSAVGSRQWAVGSGQSAVGSGQWAVGSGQWAVGSGQWAVGSRQWAVGSRQWAVGSGQWAVGSRQSAVGSGQWSVGSGQWAQISNH